IDQAAEMVFYHDLEGHIIEANQAVIKSLGYSKEELQTMNIMDIDPSAREREDMSHRWKVIKPGDPAITFEAVHRKKDGSIYPVEVTISKVVLPEGEFILGLARDIRERKQAEEKLKVSEMRFRLLAEVAPVGIVIADKDDNVVFVSKKFTEIFGYTIDDIPTIEDWYRCAYPNEPVRDRIRTIWSAAVEEARRTQAEIEPVEYAVVCKDGGIRQIEFRMAATTDLQFVLFTDITERKRIQEALELAVNSAQVGLWEQDLRTGKIIRNEEWAKMLGYDLSEVAANIDFFFDAIHPDDLPRVKETIAAHESGQTDFLQVEQRMRTKNGAWKWILNMGRVVERDINGKPVRAAGVHLDITEHKQTEEQIRIDEERLESLLRINQHPAESIQELLDFALNEAIDLTGSKIGYIYFYDEERKEFTLNSWSRDVMKECSVANPQRVYQLEKTGVWGEAVRQRRPIMVNDFEAKNPLKKGTPKGHVQLHKFLTIPVFSDSKIVAVVGVANKETDYNDSDIRQLNLMMDAVWKIVQRKQAEDALKTNFSLLKLAGETAKFGGWSIDLTENRVVWSDEVAAIHEMPAGHSPTISEVFRYYVPKWQAKILKAFNRCVEEGIAYDEEVEIITAKGKRLWVRTTGEALIDDSGKIVKIQGSFQDITERKQMEANLKASEEQLRQTQKMEALGQLASGIAHDFNNILSIILGHASLLKMSQRTPEKVQHSIATIEKAGQRGADLVKQLLTLARKNEPETKSLNLGDIIADTVKLLQETFPKTITFQTDIESDLPLVMADASQIHQVLMNLSLNARDAMPKGGTLSFNASREAGQELRQRHPNAIAREYVKLCISDSGVGMDKATVERVFEPFYTTKEQGRGTGLGLATVHGIIRNHNGFVEVESEPAAGTTFRIYLPVPVTQETLDATTAENGAATPTSASGSETILLIEDEESIIEMLTTIFRTQGYQVIVAMDGHTGVEKYKQSQNDIDLVISDMGLPRLTGEEVFYRIRRINPEARVIIASGFVDPDRKSELYKAGLTRFVQKPYFPMDILKVVREILDESPEASKENS
ncbi:MAG TPA: PAS domain S-box protein, partial [Candidatus Marinimicrobia bacterium]|nr:PAS domain S-box protein [Candidatus Neomarinimicrobiota bacterium]